MDQRDNAIQNSYQTGKAYFSDLFKRGEVPTCSTGYISGSCAGGHKFAAPYLCGKDYCKECGKDGSPIHQRRVSRWLPLTEQFKTLGYLVFTFPKSVRFLFKDKKILSDFRFQLKRKLTREKYTTGLARWHFFGDCEYCKANGCYHCNNTGSGVDFHPHLNLFINAGYQANLKEWIAGYNRFVKLYVLRQLANEVAKRTLLIEKYGTSIDHLDTVYTELMELETIIQEIKKTTFVINYSYTSNKEEIINKLKYVTRSTFRVFDKDVKDILHNFRNSVRWGFKKEVSIKAVIICDVCKAKGIEHIVKWHKLIQYTNPLTVKHYENGIYRLSLASESKGDHHQVIIRAKRLRKVASRLISSH